MITPTNKEGIKMCEAMCKIADLGRITIEQLGKAFAAIAGLTIAVDEWNSTYYKERMKIK